MIDWAILAAIVPAWCLLVTYATGGDRALFCDTFRDTAYAQNMLSGRFLSDPCISGQDFWYAPGNPLFFAGISKLTGVSVVSLYASSACWFNEDFAPGSAPVALSV